MSLEERRDCIRQDGIDSSGEVEERTLKEISISTEERSSSGSARLPLSTSGLTRMNVENEWFLVEITSTPLVKTND